MRITLLFFIICWDILAYAKWTRFHVGDCKPESLLISASSQQQDPQIFWLITTKHNQDQVQRQQIEKKWSLNGSSFLADSSLIELYDSGTIQYEVTCDDKVLAALPSPAWGFERTRNKNPSIDRVISLSQEPVRVYDETGIQQAELKQRGDSFQIEGEQIKALYSDGSVSLDSKEDTSSSRSTWKATPIYFKGTNSQAVYFEVRNLQNSESYIIQLEDAGLIAKARSAIAESKPKLVVADIEMGHGDFNRDNSSEAKTPWSWHPAKVLDINDFASIECDGSPSLVERFINSKKSYPRICFWNYFISKELSFKEVTGR